MPNYKGHIAGGVITFGLLCCIILRFTPSFFTGCEWLLCTIAGALFPDIDIKSKGQKYFYYIIFALFFFLLIKQRFEIISALSFFIIFPMLVRHRGIFHHPQFIILLSASTWFIISVLFPYKKWLFLYDILFFCFGALSHIVLDFGVRRSLQKLLRM